MRTIKIEIRADDKVQITGYVNVTGKKSRPVITKHGRCIEVIEERTFEDAIERAGNVTVTVDHDSTHIYASTESNTLKLREDAIGLHADVLIDDKNIIELARKGKIKGWSFGMYNVVDKLEQRADELPIRHVSKLDLDHITLVVNKRPVYSATSVELRANIETEIETRSSEDDVELKMVETPKKQINLSQYQNRINKLKVGK